MIYESEIEEKVFLSQLKEIGALSKSAHKKERKEKKKRIRWDGKRKYILIYILLDLCIPFFTVDVFLAAVHEEMNRCKTSLIWPSFIERKKDFNYIA